MESIEYQILEIEETNFEINSEKISEKLKEPGSIKNKIGFRFKKDPQDNVLVIEFDLTSNSAANDTNLFKISTKNRFLIKPLDKAITFNENKEQFKEKRLIGMLLNICVGAIRGIMVKELENTPLKGLTLPLLPDTLLDLAIRK